MKRYVGLLVTMMPFSVITWFGLVFFTALCLFLIAMAPDEIYYLFPCAMLGIWLGSWLRDIQTFEIAQLIPNFSNSAFQLLILLIAAAHLIFAVMGILANMSYLQILPGMFATWLVMLLFTSSWTWVGTGLFYGYLLFPASNSFVHELPEIAIQLFCIVGVIVCINQIHEQLHRSDFRKSIKLEDFSFSNFRLGHFVTWPNWLKTTFSIGTMLATALVLVVLFGREGFSSFLVTVGSLALVILPTCTLLVTMDDLPKRWLSGRDETRFKLGCVTIANAYLITFAVALLLLLMSWIVNFGELPIDRLKHYLVAVHVGGLMLTLYCLVVSWVQQYNLHGAYLMASTFLFGILCLNLTLRIDPTWTNVSLLTLSLAGLGLLSGIVSAKGVARLNLVA